MQLSVLALLLFGLAVVLFAVQNAQLVDIQFVTWRFAGVPLAFVIIGATAAGALIMLAVGLIKQLGLSLRLWDVQATVKRLENELKARNAAIEKLQLSEAALKAEVESVRDALERARQDARPAGAPDAQAGAAAAPGHPTDPPAAGTPGSRGRGRAQDAGDSTG